MAKRRTSAMCDELLPCPFCGTAEVIDPRDDKYNDIDNYPDRWLQLNEHGVTNFDVECFGCGAGQSRAFETKQEAVAAWNRRVCALTDDERITIGCTGADASPDDVKELLCIIERLTGIGKETDSCGNNA